MKENYTCEVFRIMLSSGNICEVEFQKLYNGDYLISTCGHTIGNIHDDENNNTKEVAWNSELTSDPAIKDITNKFINTI